MLDLIRLGFASDLWHIFICLLAFGKSTALYPQSRNGQQYGFSPGNKFISY
jgi:hypothetical protein